MICDTIDHASCYPLGPRFAKAFAYLQSDRPKTDAPGKYELDGDKVFALVQEYTTRTRDESLWEAHVLHADVQYLVSGREQIGYAPLHTLTLKENRAPQEDAALYTGEGSCQSLRPGMFMLLLPQDAHMPSLDDGEKSRVRKVVVKVRL